MKFYIFRSLIFLDILNFTKYNLYTYIYKSIIKNIKKNNIMIKIYYLNNYIYEINNLFYKKI